MSIAAKSVPSVTAEKFKEKIAAKTAKVGILGLGYVGLPLALLFSEERFPVTGFDVDARKVDTLAKGGSYIVRIEPSEIQSAKAHGFSATTDFSHISDMDAIIICVPTPLDEFRQPDMSYIVSTAQSIAPHLRPGQLVILESTTYPGTTEEVLVPILEKNKLGLKAAREGSSGDDDVFYVAFSPEREDPGNSFPRNEIPKVVGGLDDHRWRSGLFSLWHRSSSAPFASPRLPPRK